MVYGRSAIILSAPDLDGLWEKFKLGRLVNLEVEQDGKRIDISVDVRRIVRFGPSVEVQGTLEDDGVASHGGLVAYDYMPERGQICSDLRSGPGLEADTDADDEDSQSW